MIAATVEDGQKVRQGERLISYDTNTSKRQSMANKVNQAQQQVNKDVTQINQTPNDQSLQNEAYRGPKCLIRSTTATCTI